jgi:hypothetical protein
MKKNIKMFLKLKKKIKKVSTPSHLNVQFVLAGSFYKKNEVLIKHFYKVNFKKSPHLPKPK